MICGACPSETPLVSNGGPVARTSPGALDAHGASVDAHRARTVGVTVTDAFPLRCNAVLYYLGVNAMMGACCEAMTWFGHLQQPTAKGADERKTLRQKPKPLPINCRTHLE
eukprot:2080862-Amphidinium_carterae.1